MTTPRRRQAGEGGISEYQLRDGHIRYSIRFYVRDEYGQERRVQKRGYRTRKEAGAALRKTLTDVETNTYVKPTKLTVEQYLNTWLDGIRVRPSTLESYRRNVRLHVAPNIGSLKLNQVTGTRLAKLYRQLEASGYAKGKDAGKKGLSARSVRYVHTIVLKAFSDAVADGLLVVNPAAGKSAKPPTAAEAKAPEMVAWSPEQAKAFLAWTRENRPNHHPIWHVLIHTGCRRGELAALRWSDVDLAAATMTIYRTVGAVSGGGKTTFITGPTKTGKPRVVDLDAVTVELLRAWRTARGKVGLTLIRGDTHVFGRLDGSHMDPNGWRKTFARQVDTARDALGADKLPVIRVHDLRHTHATALLKAGTPVNVVAQRLGHTTATTTLTVYAHVLSGQQKEAAAAFAALLA